MIQIDKIVDVIADDTWVYKTKAGEVVRCKITVGKPFRETDKANSDWVCPVMIEHFTSQVVPAYGVGPVDSLMNAMTLVKSFSDLHKDDLVDIG